MGIVPSKAIITIKTMPQTPAQRKVNRVQKNYWFTKQDNEIVKELAQKHELTELQVIQIALKFLSDTNILDSCNFTITPNSTDKDDSSVLVSSSNSNN